LAQQFDALAIGAQRSTTHTEGVGDQRAAKDAAVQMNERQNTGDLIPRLAYTLMRAVAERLLDNRAPSGPVKKVPSGWASTKSSQRPRAASDSDSMTVAAGWTSEASVEVDPRGSGLTIVGEKDMVNATPGEIGE